MSLINITEWNDLLDDLDDALKVKSEELTGRYVIGTINIFDRVRYMLLVRYIKRLRNTDMYQAFVALTNSWKVGNFAVYNDLYYKCIQDADGSIAITSLEHFSPHPSFTYDYDTIVTILGKINRICGTNFTI